MGNHLLGWGPSGGSVCLTAPGPAGPDPSQQGMEGGKPLKTNRDVTLGGRRARRRRHLRRGRPQPDAVMPAETVVTA